MVHVSIHDVSPASAAETRLALQMCDAAGARAALLVVPDLHGRAPLSGDPAFCAEVRERQRRGHEVYLHGLRHQSAGAYRGPALGRIRWLFAQHVVSAGEAEMSDLTIDEGRACLEEGERALRSAGLRVDGFVAPAWSMPPWLLPVLAARGYRFTEDRLRVYDPAAARSRASVVLNWASRSRARRLATVAWCRAARHARALVPARIAIHPGDLRFASLRREIAGLLAWARDDFVASGRDLLA